MRRYLGYSLLIIAVLTLTAWAISRYIQPILPADLNSDIVLFFVALLAVTSILANLKDISEFMKSLAEKPKSPTPEVPTWPTLTEFEKAKLDMPQLIAEMKNDLTSNRFIREFFIISRHWVLNAHECFVYYFEDHDNLEGKMHILENYGFVKDVTPGNAKMYRMSEKFVDLILES